MKAYSNIVARQLAETKPMMIIDKDTVSATRQKIADPKKLKQATKDVKKMLEIKEALK